jgi:hypothetical protein
MEDMFAGKVRRNLSGLINMVDWDHPMDATNGRPPSKTSNVLAEEGAMMDRERAEKSSGGVLRRFGGIHQELILIC